MLAQAYSEGLGMPDSMHSTPNYIYLAFILYYVLFQQHSKLGLLWNQHSHFVHCA